jgi:hypothetical protein
MAHSFLLAVGYLLTPTWHVNFDLGQTAGCHFGFHSARQMLCLGDLLAGHLAGDDTSVP